MWPPSSRCRSGARMRYGKRAPGRAGRASSRRARARRRPPPGCGRTRAQEVVRLARHQGAPEDVAVAAEELRGGVHGRGRRRGRRGAGGRASPWCCRRRSARRRRARWRPGARCRRPSTGGWRASPPTPAACAAARAASTCAGSVMSTRVVLEPPGRELLAQEALGARSTCRSGAMTWSPGVSAEKTADGGGRARREGGGGGPAVELAQALLEGAARGIAVPRVEMSARVAAVGIALEGRGGMDGRRHRARWPDRRSGRRGPPGSRCASLTRSFTARRSASGARRARVQPSARPRRADHAVVRVEGQGERLLARVGARCALAARRPRRAGRARPPPGARRARGTSTTSRTPSQAVARAPAAPSATHAQASRGAGRSPRPRRRPGRSSGARKRSPSHSTSPRPAETTRQARRLEMPMKSATKSERGAA